MSETAAVERIAAESVPESEFRGTRTITPDVYRRLPRFLKIACNSFDNPYQKDVFLLSALGALSGCFDTVTGEYYDEILHANLFVYIIAPPASGKGSMLWAQRLITPLHKHVMEEATISADQNQQKVLPEQVFDFNEPKKGLEKMAFPKMLLTPANLSAAALFQHLKSNDGNAIIIETEADTLANALEKDYGGFSDVLRKTFHHETVSSSRKGNFEYIEVDKPRLSMILTSTPDQVRSILPSEKNGLSSRFLFHCFRTPPIWHDPSPYNRRVKKDRLFSLLGKVLVNFTKSIDGQAINFSMPEPLWRMFNITQEKLLAKAVAFVGEDSASIVYRLGVIKYRIAMLLSILRQMEAKTKPKQHQIVCSTEDLMTACQLIDFSYDHSVSIYNYLSGNKQIGANKSKSDFYDRLPVNKNFGRTDAQQIGNDLGHHEKTVDNYLRSLSLSGLLVKDKHNSYRKK